MMQCTLPTQGMRSIISMVSISAKVFLPSILLLVVIIITVVIVVVTVILVVVVVAIIGVVIVVMIIGVVVVVMIIGVVGVIVVSSIIKLSFVIIEAVKRFGIGILAGQGILGESTSSKFHVVVLGVSLGSVFLFGLSVLAMVAACASKAAAWCYRCFSRTGSLPSGCGGKKCRESNIGDSDNTGDGGKIVGEAIGACGGIGERASEAKRSLVKSSKKLGEVFPGEAGK
ncbi:hypothetical protein Tco_1052205 [Tanacetum coccineum]